ncbi:MAG TPA: ATP-binding protein [Patescibacteria group bacterium]|nr:ATP-binding protein [Patescibacteria group bacterium]
MDLRHLATERWSASTVLFTVASLIAVSGLVAVLEGPIGVPNASSAYLLAVLVCAMAFGTWSGILAAIGGFLLYDFFFVEPIHTFVVSDPGEWLNLVLLLVGGIVVGQLAATQRARAEAAVEREREAIAQFRVSRVLATRSATIAVLPEIAGVLRTEVGFERVWIALDRPAAPERIVADTGGSTAIPTATASHAVLRRTPGDTPAEWVKVHQPGIRRAGDSGLRAHRVIIEAAGRTIGSVWGLRARSAGEPGRAETRLLAAAADQVGQALEQDRLAAEAQAAEIARQSDALKSALLESVSHDLRTPLATIRAAAGTMLDRQLVISDEDRRASALAIDREAEHLNRLVTNLLDLSRIEAGALRADLEPVDLTDAIEPAVARLADRLKGRTVEIDLTGATGPALVDAVFLDQVITNLLENAAKYVPAGALVRVSATRHDDVIRLTVEDSGPGVPAEALPRLFEKFYRVQARTARSRPGTGVGLAVVRGLTEAMGGGVGARSSDLGGLAIDVDLPRAPDRPDGNGTGTKTGTASEPTAI